MGKPYNYRVRGVRAWTAQKTVLYSTLFFPEQSVRSFYQQLSIEIEFFQQNRILKKMFLTTILVSHCYDSFNAKTFHNQN